MSAGRPKWIYAVRIGSADGPLYWGYYVGQPTFDTPDEAAEHAAAAFARDVNGGRATQPKSNLYLCIHPPSVTHVRTPGTW